jgi:hypothetical protein
LKEEVPSRSVIQIRTHAQKFFLKIGKYVAPGEDIIEFVRSKSLDFFAEMSNEMSQEGVNKANIKEGSNNNGIEENKESENNKSDGSELKLPLNGRHNSNKSPDESKSDYVPELEMDQKPAKSSSKYCLRKKRKTE